EAAFLYRDKHFCTRWACCASIHHQKSTVGQPQTALKSRVCSHNQAIIIQNIKLNRIAKDLREAIQLKMT
ncbi:MAG: hypothetical protein ACRCU5_05825, partial [Rhizobiaceae bacterium]